MLLETIPSFYFLISSISDSSIVAVQTCEVGVIPAY
jgi:hypothetical protein